MRTNDLFRDLLDGRIPMPRRRIKPGFYFLPAGSFDPAAPTMSDLTKAIADPRTIALTTKAHRNTGPAPEPLRTRGRNNHYRTKG